MDFYEHMIESVKERVNKPSIFSTFLTLTSHEIKKLIRSKLFILFIIVNILIGMFFLLTINSVANSNADPLITTDTPDYILSNTTFKIDFEAADFDSDSKDQRWFLAYGPDFIAVNKTTGIMSLNPNGSHIARHLIVINVTDGDGGHDEMFFFLDVLNKNPSIYDETEYISPGKPDQEKGRDRDPQPKMAGPITSFLFFSQLVSGIIIIGLCAGSVSSEVGGIADSVLSKSANRMDYISSKFASRLITIVGFHAGFVCLLGWLFSRMGDETVPIENIILSAIIIECGLIFFIMMSILISSISSSTIFSVITAIVLWTVLPRLLNSFNDTKIASTDHLLELIPDFLAGVADVNLWCLFGAYLIPSAIFFVAAIFIFHRRDL